MIHYAHIPSTDISKPRGHQLNVTFIQSRFQHQFQNT